MIKKLSKNEPNYGLTPRMGAKKGIGTLPLPEKSGGRTGKGTCKSVEKEKNHEKVPPCPWARSQMGNPS
jgi:hypothetical protein